MEKCMHMKNENSTTLIKGLKKITKLKKMKHIRTKQNNDKAKVVNKEN